MKSQLSQSSSWNSPSFLSLSAQRDQKHARNPCHLGHKRSITVGPPYCLLFLQKAEKTHFANPAAILDTMTHVNSRSSDITVSRACSVFRPGSSFKNLLQEELQNLVLYTAQAFWNPAHWLMTNIHWLWHYCSAQASRAGRMQKLLCTVHSQLSGPILP